MRTRAAMAVIDRLRANMSCRTVVGMMRSVPADNDARNQPDTHSNEPVVVVPGSVPDAAVVSPVEAIRVVDRVGLVLDDPKSRRVHDEARSADLRGVLNFGWDACGWT